MQEFIDRSVPPELTELCELKLRFWRLKLITYGLDCEPDIFESLEARIAYLQNLLTNGALADEIQTTKS